jgi:hypothetical protein
MGKGHAKLNWTEERGWFAIVTAMDGSKRFVGDHPESTLKVEPIKALAKAVEHCQKAMRGE